MAHFTLKKCETPHAMTIDIVDEANNIQGNTQCCGTLNLTWIWDGVTDKKEEKERLLKEIQDDLSYVEETFGYEMANAILKFLNQKIDRAYATAIH
jgi:hypothetical protein